MSEKPKVYQGVRVKTTVKELLQQRRALQAAAKATVTSQSSNAPFPDTSATSFAAPYYTPAPVNVPETNCFTPMQITDSFFYEQVVSAAFDNQPVADIFSTCEHFIDQASPVAGFQHTSLGNLQQGPDYCSGMESSSSSNSSNVSSPADYSSCSPPQCYASFSSAYASPAHFSPRAYAPVHEDCHYQPCELPYRYCLSQVQSPQDNLRLPEYMSYPSSDCAYSTSMVEDSFFMREMTSWDMCFS
ncbi:colorectal cancer associated 2 [Erpetoichthys calabaricus]|uniref:colorectal cancer associated 2 n=1 Tax=Erpetoichthys calabaricus TaxID=27687 RepID=UPI00109F0C71|nr:colorectal cancer associated 2 [Erpetoichthys calabaricus]